MAAKKTIPTKKGDASKEPAKRQAAGARTRANDRRVAQTGKKTQAASRRNQAGSSDPAGNVESSPRVASPQILTPRNLLLPYQRDWTDDDARWKIGLWSRQAGKDFSSGAEGVGHCFQVPKTTWLIAAPSERQSLESFEKWKEWAEAYQLAIADITEERDAPEALLKSSTMILPNGSRVIAVPGRPDTVRGYSANVLLTEFGFFEEPDATWRAILPSVTNPLRGGLKRVRLISTPNGVGNKLHDLWVKNYGIEGSKWSCHLVDIHRAVAEGLPLDIEEQREALDDPEGWAQEYECQFLDVSAVLLPYDLIALNESAEATATAPADFWHGSGRNQAPVFLGLDFGRKRDLTVCWAAEKVASDLAMTREVLELAKTSTPDQVEILRPRIQRAQRVCLDYTGPGVGLGDLLVKEFGEYAPDRHLFGKIELCTFTNNLKVDIFPKLRMSFESHGWRIPVNRTIREDLHSISRVTTPSGNITYRAPHTKDGHADRCTALALCHRACSAPLITGRFSTPDTRRNRALSERRNRRMLG